MRLRTILYSLALLPVVAPMTLKAQSGACGVTVTWQLSDSTLTISGQGDMYDNYYAESFSYALYSERVGRVVINDGITSVGSNAFNGFANLRSVVLPASVTTINDNSFANTRLNSVTIPSSVVSLGYRCFANTEITKVDVPSNVKGVGIEAFADNSNLKDVSWNVSVPYEEVYLSGRIFNNVPLNTITFGPDAKYIYENMMVGAYPGYDIKSSGVIEYIGVNAFTGSKWLSENSEEQVLYYEKCLYSCGNGFNSPTNLSVKSGTVGITGDAFKDNRNLVGITIPESVEMIGYGAFENTPSLSQISWNAVNCKIGGLWLGAGLSEITFGDKVEVIPEGLCSGCTGLRSLAFPESLKVIGGNAFYGCTGIEDIQFNAALDSIAGNAFGDCKKLKAAHLTARIIDSYAFECPDVTEITISDNVREIGTGNFSDVKIGTLRIPATLEKMHTWYNNGFMNYGHINNVIIECEDASEVVNGAFVSTTINNMEFADGVKNCQWFSVVDTVVVSSSVVKLDGGQAGILIYNAVAATDASSINCYYLKIGDGVQRIPANLVYGENITNVEIPQTVTEIGDNAFQCCNLESVVAPWYDPREINASENAFSGNESRATLYVPQGREDAYSRLKPWSEFLWIKAIDGSTEINEVAAPTITYANGALIFESETPDVEFHYTITDEDIVADQTSYGTVYLNACYHVTAYASAKGMLNSRTSAATLYFIDAKLDDAGLIDVPAKRGVLVTTSGSIVKVSGLDVNEAVEIYDINGRLAGQGVAADGTCVITVNSDQSVLLVHTSTGTVKIKR